jgi:hypothetical protein
VAVAFDVVSAENIAALVAAVAAGVGALVALVVVVVLTRRVRELQEIVQNLGNEAMPLVRDARVVMDHAAMEMERVGDVLATTEAVSGTVDSASRLAYRIFANPVVKFLAFGTGVRSALRRLFSRRGPTNRRATGRAAVTATAGVTARATGGAATTAGDGGIERGTGRSLSADAGPATEGGMGRTGEAVATMAPSLAHRRRRARRSRSSRDSTSR